MSASMWRIAFLCIALLWRPSPGASLLGNRTLGALSWVETNMVGFDMPKFNPHVHAMPRESCRHLCASMSTCAAAVWSESGNCYIKSDIGDLVFERHTYVILRPEKFLYVLSNLVEVMEPPPETLYIVLWCGGGFNYRKPVSEELLAETTVLVGRPHRVTGYDICTERSGYSFGASSTSVIISHLLVNMAGYESGSIRWTVFIIEKAFADADKHGDDAPSLHTWTLDEFVGVTMTVAWPLQGVHIVHTVPLRTGHVDALLDISHTLFAASPHTSQSFIQKPKLGLPSCKRGAVQSGGDQGGGEGVVGDADESAAQPSSTIPTTPVAASKRRKYAIVTMVTQGYLTMARVLLHSLSKFSVQTEVVVALLDIDSPHDGNRNMTNLILEEFPHVRVVEWPTIFPPESIGAFAPRRWDVVYSKLNIFNMAEYERILYVDADTMAMRNPDFIFEHKLVSASQMPCLYAPDWNKWRRPPAVDPNSGMLLVRPSADLFACVRKAMLDVLPEDFYWNEGDQAFMHYVFGDVATKLPFNWNTQQGAKAGMASLWEEDKIVFLHYAGGKPDRSWSPREYYRMWRTTEWRERLRSVDELHDESPESAELFALWRKEYFDLVRFPQHLHVFVAYHDAASYATVVETARFDSDLFVPISLGELLAPNNLSAAHVVESFPSLTHSEFAVLVALAEATWYQKAWIGFTTCGEHKKALLREGAAADWVKVEDAIRQGPQERVVLFWFGIFAGNYWALMDLHHPGMRRVYRRILGKMNIDIDDVHMPKDRFWPFNNFVIMPHVLLREFAAFAREFMSHFEAEYGRTGSSTDAECPFSNPSVANVDYFESRCLGYACENLMHIWSVLKDVELRYIVDDAEMRYRLGCMSHPVHCAMQPGRGRVADPFMSMP